ncbi:MAG: hypothetical protein M3384_05580 [Acidobacteriota bacterium]|nr:hypothetical protein [Acidobacteriota bacterium]
MNTSEYGFIFSFKSKVCGFCLLVGGLFLSAACQSAVTPVGKLQPTPTPTPTPEVKEAKDDFSEKLEYVRKGAFGFIYVFRRKDGAALDAEDRKYLRANSPVETNQWVLTDDARAAIAGSNYQFPPEMLDALKKRFNVEDLSEAPATTTAAEEAAKPEAANSNAGNKANSNAESK